MAEYPDPDDYPSPDLRPFMAADVATRELPDFEAEGLLEGVEEANRAARIKLLTELYIEDGVDLETLKEEAEANRLALLPADLVLGRSNEKYTPNEIAELAGLSVTDFQKLIAAVGLPSPRPDQRTFDDADLLAARRLKRFQEAGIPTENLLAATRQVGSSAARIAQAHRDLVASDIITPGADEYEAAIQLRQASLQTCCRWPKQAVDYALRSHFLDQPEQPGDGNGQARVCSAAARGRRFRSASPTSSASPGSVSEASWKRSAPSQSCSNQVAIDVTNPEVRLVKTIGDAAMLVSEDGAALL